MTVVIVCTCGTQKPHWTYHKQDCAMKLAGLLSEERATVREQQALIQKMVDAWDNNDRAAYQGIIEEMEGLDVTNDG